ncbi:MAG TPA: DNA polymerase III subunit delta [Bryobacteraceae bacterium]|nr:DNA polymerase III subunit delta [Bryobacteraceae bacterium]
MTPEQFLESLQRKGPEPAYLFLGTESYNRDRCRRALIEAALPEGERESGFTRHDLDQIPLAAALDDARSLSLFAARRVLWLARAEAALPKGRAADAEEDASTSQGGAKALEEYMRQPAPGTILAIDCARYDFEGEDKARLERVRKYFSAVPAQVEFRPFSPEMARALAQNLARSMGVRLGLPELALLLEATGGEASRIAAEMEKLKLFAGDRKVTAEDIVALAPEAHSTTIFAMVAALGRGDRARALETLDTLSRAGEYMPMALTFLSTQFRMALAARDAGLRSPSEIQAHFNRLGVRIWAERARQISETIHAFPKGRLEQAIGKLFEADRALRDARPDDRIVMEEMVFDLTAARSGA